ncbi:galactose-binding domain-like protein [Tuber borchii]|uniref:allantoicase n=1 Tax=Tuber borchii TaxID=42251 RepID=A0A2T7A3K1_TUBBO|nr:galactose-binding domain-like protein [Tuber borchii]
MPSNTVHRISESKAQETFGSSCIDLISSDLGGQVLEVSDEWFAAASNLINPAPPIRKPGLFVPTGAWYDGWETRRHNKAPADWVIIKLGVASGKVHGFEVDTAFFSGNHAPAVTVEGTFLEGGHPDANTAWEEILPMQACGPSQRHIWQLDSPTAKAYSHVRLKMFPDGGISRFRLFGTVVPVFPSDPDAIIDLAHVSSGGLAISCSEQHFGTKTANLLLPGRGKDAGNGWETRRSREPGHVDWVVVKLGAPGYIEEIIVDTLHFRGNYPQAVEIYAINSSDQHIAGDANGWELIVPKHSCEADKEHAFTSILLQNVNEKVVTHVKMVIIPDGGVKRLRVFGKRATSICN